MKKVAKPASVFNWRNKPSETGKAIKPGNARRYGLEVTHHANQWASIATAQAPKAKPATGKFATV